MGMVEKVARRLWGQEHVLSLGTYSADDFAWHVTPERDKEKFRMMARAAIEAMREPTEEMWAAAWLIYHPWGVNAPDPRDRPNAFDAMKEKTSAILAAMIDKAIQESGE